MNIKNAATRISPNAAQWFHCIDVVLTQWGGTSEPGVYQPARRAAVVGARLRARGIPENGPRAQAR
ncbi:hypothetical protein VDF34_14710, partial [Xanthomonas campestris pv. raphani]